MSQFREQERTRRGQSALATYSDEPARSEDMSTPFDLAPAWWMERFTERSQFVSLSTLFTSESLLSLGGTVVGLEYVV
jgi:hypothetical protein